MEFKSINMSKDLTIDLLLNPETWAVAQEPQGACTKWLLMDALINCQI